MLEQGLGKRQTLTVVKQTEFGVYLGTEEERVLLPRKQVPPDARVGDEIEVFLYRDSRDRLIATTNEPKIQLGEVKLLTVKDTAPIGAFLDWGLEKDLFLPFKQQTAKVKKGDQCLVSLYVDKSGRLCATMKVYPLLRTDSPYQKNDMVRGTVYGISREFGVFVAVDDRYSALIPRREVYGRMFIGQQVEARVADVKADGKLDLSVRGRIPEQMDADAQQIMERIEKNGGSLPFTDKADPERIKMEFGMSKAAFKRAVGRLLKQRKITIDENQGKILQSR